MRTTGPLLFICFSLLLCLPVPATFAEDAAPADLPAPTLPDKHYDGLSKPQTGVLETVISTNLVQLSDGTLLELNSLDFPDLYRATPGDVSLQAFELMKETYEGQRIKYVIAAKAENQQNRLGHTLAHIMLKDEPQSWAQGLLLQRGLARVRTTTPHRAFASEMLAIEEGARKNERGLWLSEAYAVKTSESAPDAEDGYHLVTGRITGVAIHRNRIFLNFGADWRSDLTVSIPPGARRLFAREGHDPLQWTGRNIRARGWLREYNGPYIEIDHPQRIEFLETAQSQSQKAASDGSALPVIPSSP